MYHTMPHPDLFSYSLIDAEVTHIFRALLLNIFVKHRINNAQLGKSVADVSGSLFDVCDVCCVGMNEYNWLSHFLCIVDSRAGSAAQGAVIIVYS